MKAENTRRVINRWYGQQVYRTKKFETKAFAMQLEQKSLEELQELEAKAAKWDMIQWAIDKNIWFVQKYNGGCIPVSGLDLMYLEELYKEREQING